MKTDNRISIERLALAGVASMTITLPLAQAAAYLAERGLGAAPPGTSSWALSLGVLALLALTSVATALGGGPALLTTLAAAGVGFAALGPTAPGAAATLAVLGLVAAPLVRGLAHRLPRALDGALGRRPLACGLWLLLGLGGALQTARTAAFVADPTLSFGPVLPGYFDQHSCLASYFQAAEMDAAGEENVYDACHYPGLEREARPETEVRGMQAFLEDPYQYPPPFLLLPKLGLALSSDFGTLRIVWFALSSCLYLGTALALARWIGGRAGLFAGLAIPVVWSSIPTMLGQQYGQFHLAALSLALLAMLAVEHGRRATGGALLAAASLAKLFPAALLLVWIVRRRSAAVAWTVAYGALFSLAGLVFLGPHSFAAFFEYHLPRLASGQAFAFHEAWPEMSAILAAANQSPLGLVQKLGQLGFELPASFAGTLNGLHGLALVAVVLVSAGRVRKRAAAARLWVAVLLLASMRSGGAWADYVMTAGLWCLSLWGSELGARTAGRLALGVATLVLFLLPGIVPLPSLPSVPVMMVCSIAGYAIALAVGFGGAWSAAVSAREPSSSPMRAALES